MLGHKANHNTFEHNKYKELHPLTIVKLTQEKVPERQPANSQIFAN